MYALLEQAYSEQCLSKPMVKRRHKLYSEGGMKVGAVPCGLTKRTVATEVIVNIVTTTIQEERHISTRKLIRVKAQHFEINNSLNPLERLGYATCCFHIGPHHLTVAQMNQYVEARDDNLGCIAKEPDFLSHIIMESWVHYHDPFSKRESEHWKFRIEPKQKKIRQQRSAGKVIKTFFDARIMIYRHHCDLPIVKGRRRSVSKEYYLTELKQLSRHIREKRPELKDQFVLHPDNTSPHAAHLVQEWLDPTYSLDLALCDFWLFPTLKMALRGRHFPTDAEVLQVVDTFQSLTMEDFHQDIPQQMRGMRERVYRSLWAVFRKRADPKCDL